MFQETARRKYGEEVTSSPTVSRMCPARSALLRHGGEACQQVTTRVHLIQDRITQSAPARTVLGSRWGVRSLPEARL
jgi:hypothetical protein